MYFLLGAFKNEYIKKQRRVVMILLFMFFIMIGILLMQLLNSYITFLPSSPPSVHWSTEYMQEAKQIQQQLDSPDSLSPSKRATAIKRLNLINYHLNKEISPSSKDAVHSMMSSMQGVFIRIILPLIIILVGADVFSAEYSTKTLKMPLLHPLGRSRLLWAKWLWLTAVSTLLLLAFYIFLFVINLRNGMGNFSDPIVISVQTPQEISGYTYLIIGLIANLLVISCYSSFILFISYFIRSVAASSAILLGIFIFSKLLLDLQYKIQPIKYVFLNHVDLLAQLNATSINGTSIWMSAVILVCSSVFLYALVWIHFRKSDINV